MYCICSSYLDYFCFREVLLLILTDLNLLWLGADFILPLRVGESYRVYSADSANVCAMTSFCCISTWPLSSRGIFLISRLSSVSNCCTFIPTWFGLVMTLISGYLDYVTSNESKSSKSFCLLNTWPQFKKVGAAPIYLAIVEKGCIGMSENVVVFFSLGRSPVVSVFLHLVSKSRLILRGLSVFYLLSSWNPLVWVLIVFFSDPARDRRCSSFNLGVSKMSVSCVTFSL